MSASLHLFLVSVSYASQVSSSSPLAELAAGVAALAAAAAEVEAGTATVTIEVEVEIGAAAALVLALSAAAAADGLYAALVTELTADFTGSESGVVELTATAVATDGA